MAFDECTPYPSDHKTAGESMKLTHRWLDRGLGRFRETSPLYGYEQQFFPIVQGSTFPDLRRESATEIASRGAAGNAIGGLSVGEPAEVMYDIMEIVNEILPEDKPRYLMGVGTPLNILEGIERGIDMFDCVMPTRNGRNGMLFTKNGKMSLKQARYRQDPNPPDDACTCYTCRNFSRAYLRHLFVTGEILSSILNTIHNLHFYLELMSDIRHSIREQKFNDLRKRIKEIYND
jgi:queuine tRNA-ribosyltransferase